MKNSVVKITSKTIAFLLIVSMNSLLSINPVIAYENLSKDAILKIVNKERIQNGSSPLVINNKLMNAAKDKANYLIETKTFEHNADNKKFSDWIKKSGYDYSFIGENLAENYKTNESVVSAWLKSESHKENMLNNNFSQTGIYIAQKNDRVIVVQIFGRPYNSPLSLEKTIKDHVSENMLIMNERFEIQITSNIS